MIPALSTMVCARVKSASVAAALSASQISVQTVYKQTVTYRQGQRGKTCLLTVK
jgi:hypothetical protein